MSVSLTLSRAREAPPTWQHRRSPLLLVSAQLPPRHAPDAHHARHGRAALAEVARLWARVEEAACAGDGSRGAPGPTRPCSARHAPARTSTRTRPSHKALAQGPRAARAHTHKAHAHAGFYCPRRGRTMRCGMAGMRRGRWWRGCSTIWRCVTRRTSTSLCGGDSPVRGETNASVSRHLAAA